jgi:hypothetical protein
MLTDLQIVELAAHRARAQCENEELRAMLQSFTDHLMSLAAEKRRQLEALGEEPK